MPLLMTCSRCTQSLPTTADFCRRCGLNVRGAARPLPPLPARRGRSVSIVGPMLAAGVIGLVAVGLVGAFVLAHTRTETVTNSPEVFNAPAPASNVVVTPAPPAINYAPARTYPPTMLAPPGYPSVPAHTPPRVIVPAYPVRPTPREHVYVQQHRG